MPGVFVGNATTEQYRIDDFDRTVRNNLRPAFLMTKFALPHLQKTRGNILFTGSEAGLNGIPMFAPYGGTKGFLHAFMKGVALEQAPHGVRANCVCPGAIDTAWTRGATSPIEPAAQEMLDNMIPLGRRGTTEEIANIFAFLASDEASYVTGALWLADGGITPAKGTQVCRCPLSCDARHPAHCRCNTLPMVWRTSGWSGEPASAQSARKRHAAGCTSIFACAFMNGVGQDISGRQLRD